MQQTYQNKMELTTEVLQQLEIPSIQQQLAIKHGVDQGTVRRWKKAYNNGKRDFLLTPAVIESLKSILKNKNVLV